jgi:hypothetical protein
MIPNYENDGPTLVAKDPETNRELWSWSCNDGNIAKIAGDVFSGGCMVLIDGSKEMSTRNILYFCADGQLAWAAEEPPEFGGYVDVCMQSEGIGASSWAGHNFLLSRETGVILRQEYAK